MTEWNIRVKFEKDSDTVKYSGTVDINDENFNDVAEELYAIMQSGNVKAEIVLVDAI